MNETTVKCEECRGDRAWLLLVGGRYLCQGCIDNLYNELVALREECRRLNTDLKRKKWC